MLSLAELWQRIKCRPYHPSVKFQQSEKLRRHPMLFEAILLTHYAER